MEWIFFQVMGAVYHTRRAKSWVQSENPHSPVSGLYGSARGPLTEGRTNRRQPLPRPRFRWSPFSRFPAGSPHFLVKSAGRISLKNPHQHG